MSSTNVIEKKTKKRGKTYSTLITTVPKKIERFLKLKKASKLDWNINDNELVTVNKQEVNDNASD